MTAHLDVFMCPLSRPIKETESLGVSVRLEEPYTQVVQRTQPLNVGILYYHIICRLSRVLEDPWHNAACLGCPRSQRPPGHHQCCSPALWTFPLSTLYHFCSLSAKVITQLCVLVKY